MAANGQIVTSETVLTIARHKYKEANAKQFASAIKQSVEESLARQGVKISIEQRLIIEGMYKAACAVLQVHPNLGRQFFWRRS